MEQSKKERLSGGAEQRGAEHSLSAAPPAEHEISAALLRSLEILDVKGYVCDARVVMSPEVSL